MEQSEKFLTFFLDDEEYGIEILKVREIIGMLAITPVPQSPQHLKGIINLRGKVIPVLDLRLLFGMDEGEYNKETCIIIVDVNNSLVGVVVDTVSEVIVVNPKDYESKTNIPDNQNHEFIRGILKVNEKIRILIDIDSIFLNGIGLL